MKIKENTHIRTSYLKKKWDRIMENTFGELWNYPKGFPRPDKIHKINKYENF